MYLTTVLTNNIKFDVMRHATELVADNASVVSVIILGKFCQLDGPFAISWRRESSHYRAVILLPRYIRCGIS